MAAETPVPTDKLGKLEWATPASDVPDTDKVPLNELLQGLQLLASDEARTKSSETNASWDAATPASMQVIKSGSLEITKYATKLVTRAGGGLGVVTAVAGIISSFIDKIGEPVTIALIGSAAVLLSSTAIALALFVKGDLEARGAATAARHQGRADVAAAFLKATSGLPSKKTATTTSSTASFLGELLSAISAYPGIIKVTTSDYKGDTPVVGIRRLAKDGRTDLLLKITTTAGTGPDTDWVPITDVTTFTCIP
jgi:hypothetical protein